MNCDTCGSAMAELFTSVYCPRCDERGTTSGGFFVVTCLPYEICVWDGPYVASVFRSLSLAVKKMEDVRKCGIDAFVSPLKGVDSVEGDESDPHGLRAYGSRLWIGERVVESCDED